MCQDGSCLLTWYQISTPLSIPSTTKLTMPEEAPARKAVWKFDRVSWCLVFKWCLTFSYPIQYTAENGTSRNIVGNNPRHKVAGPSCWTICVIPFQTAMEIKSVSERFIIAKKKMMLTRKSFRAFCCLYSCSEKFHGRDKCCCNGYQIMPVNGHPMLFQVLLTSCNATCPKGWIMMEHSVVEPRLLNVITNIVISHKVGHCSRHRHDQPCW